MNAEKILYFAKKNGPAGFDARKHVSGALQKSLTNMVNNKYLTEKKDMGGSTYFVTPRGELKLLSLQIKARLSMSKEIDTQSNLFLELMKNVIGRQDEVYAAFLLEKNDSLMVGDNLTTKGAKELVRYGVLAHQAGAEKGVFCLTTVGLAVKKKALSLFAPKAKSIAHDDLELHQKQLSAEGVDAVMKTLTQSFNGSLDAVCEVYHGDPQTTPVLMEELALMELVTLVGEDDAASYFSMNQNGLDFCIDFEIGLRKEAGLSIDGIKEQRLQSSVSKVPVAFEGVEVLAPDKFDPQMDLGAYRNAGDQLAKSLLGDDIYSKVNELHWDEAHDNQLPLSAALKDLTRHAFVFKPGMPPLVAPEPIVNTPSETLSAETEALVSSVLDMFGNELNEEQLKGAIFAMSFQETGVSLSQKQLDAALNERSRVSPSIRR